MKLALQLGLTFGVLTCAATTALGFGLRTSLVEDEAGRFEADVKLACQSVQREVEHQAERDQKLLESACAKGSLVDRAATAIDSGELDAHRLPLAALVGSERNAFDFDELALVTSSGEVLGAEPKAVLTAGTPQLVERGRSKPGISLLPLLATGRPALAYACKKPTSSGWVALEGSRQLGPLLLRVATNSGVEIDPQGIALNEMAQLPCEIAMGANRHRFVIGKSQRAFHAQIARIDATVLAGSGIATVLALLIATFLARRQASSIAALAHEAAKVARGEARPVEPRGSSEVQSLGRAFSKMLADLETTRHRLAVASRVAAWQEVARRLAHEIKNPLMPIRAAVETLRRLRAREDPAFEEYFDEASRTVLDEVQRITHIVSEFTHFARLPAPKPETFDLRAVIEDQARIHRATAEGALIGVEVPPDLGLRADREQVTQVVANLLQNALDAVRDVPSPTVHITARREDPLVVVTVEDNGEGVPLHVRPRLFEPYATSKAHGTGLGLAIAQRIAMDHGGDLSYVGPGRPGTPHPGAIFRLELPLAGPSPTLETPPNESGTKLE